MTPDLQSRIHKAIMEAHHKGVKANLIILGRAEELLLEGEDPNKNHDFGCAYIIDQNSKSRCDAFGQQSTHYVQSQPRPESNTRTEIQAVQTARRKQELERAHQPKPQVPSLYKQSILKAGFIDRSFTNRYKESVELYEFKDPSHTFYLSMEKLKSGEFKLYNTSDDTVYFQGPIPDSATLKELIQKIPRL